MTVIENFRRAPATLERLFKSGNVKPDEVYVLHEVDALPETILACKASDVSYFETKLRPLLSGSYAVGVTAAATDQFECRQRDSFGLVTGVQLERIDELFEFINTRF